MPRYRIGMSDTFRAFIEVRVIACAEDHGIARGFYGSRIDYTDEDAHNFYDAVLSDGKPAISYTTSKRYKGHEDHNIYARESFRITGKPGKVAQRVTGITDGRALDVFVGALAAHLSPPDPNLLQVAEGRDITYWYADTHYCRCNGYLSQGPWTSCMRSASNGRVGRFRVYEESAKMLIRLCKDCGQLQGRAILWHDNDGGQWIDRIYATTRVAEQMRQWATKNGYQGIYAYGEGYDATKKKDFQIDVSREGLERMPYFDTMASCGRCFRIGTYRPHACYSGVCRPHGKTFTIPEGRWAGAADDDAPITCDSCQHEVNEYGHCEFWMTCESCGAEYCCYRDNCPNDCQQCERCEVWYADGAACPNEEYCEIHDEWYCGECPHRERCRNCGFRGCDETEARHHQYCEVHEAWYCAHDGGTCHDAPACDECGDAVPCDEAENYTVLRPRQRYLNGQAIESMRNVQLCEDCWWITDQAINDLMINMIPPAAQAEMPLCA